MHRTIRSRTRLGAVVFGGVPIASAVAGVASADQVNRRGPGSAATRSFRIRK